MQANWREFWKGVLAQLPLQLGVVPFGLIFGVKIKISLILFLVI